MNLIYIRLVLPTYDSSEENDDSGDEDSESSRGSEGGDDEIQDHKLGSSRKRVKKASDFGRTLPKIKSAAQRSISTKTDGHSRGSKKGKHAADDNRDTDDVDGAARRANALQELARRHERAALHPVAVQDVTAATATLTGSKGGGGSSSRRRLMAVDDDDEEYGRDGGGSAHGSRDLAAAMEGIKRRRLTSAAVATVEANGAGGKENTSEVFEEDILLDDF